MMTHSEEQRNNAVIYVRVSTKEQVDEGNSLVTQERLCNEYAARKNFRVVQTFIELGESAKSADRTELKKLMSFCTSKKNKVNAVIVYKIDRLSRNITDYSHIRFNLKRFGIEIKSTTENFEDNPAGRFMENIIANVAQFDNEVRAERSLNGLKEAIREGRYVWMAPIGYSNGLVNGKASIIPNQDAPFIKRAFEMLAGGNTTIEETRTKLFELGLKRGNNQMISKSAFHRVIKNELYAGWINMFGERTKGTYDPLIPEELFNTVQRIISKQTGKRQYSRIHPSFPLRQFCSNQYGTKLSGAFSRSKSKRRYPYYFFKRDFQYFPKETFDKLFVDYFNSFHFQPEKLKQFRHSLRVELRVALEKINATRKMTLQKVANQEEIKNTLVHKLSEGILSNALFQEQLDKVQAKIVSLNLSLDKLPKYDINLDQLYLAIKGFLISPGSFWQKASLNTKLKLQVFVFPRGIIYETKELRTPEIRKGYKDILSKPIQFSQVVAHPNLISNTLEVANADLSAKEIDIYKYFSQKDYEKIEEYMEFFLELERIVRGDKT